MKIILADSQPSVRRALRVLLERHVSYQIVGETNSFDRLCDLIEHHKPDVVLLDWDILNCKSQERMQNLRLRYPFLWLIALSGRPEIRHDSLLAGANAFVSKSEPPDRLLATLNALPNQI
jgi:DNA-binding NarL/FixJ family response regulator